MRIIGAGGVRLWNIQCASFIRASQYPLSYVPKYAVDAEAIHEAALRPAMSFVPVTTEQRDLQVLHRTRDWLIAQRNALINHIRGLLGNMGLSFWSVPFSSARTSGILLLQPSCRFSLQRISTHSLRNLMGWTNTLHGSIASWLASAEQIGGANV